MTVSAEWDVAFEAHEPVEPLDDVHETCNVARCRRAVVARMLSLFIVLEILLYAVTNEITSDTRTVGVKSESLLD